MPAQVAAPVAAAAPEIAAKAPDKPTPYKPGAHLDRRGRPETLLASADQRRLNDAYYQRAADLAHQMLLDAGLEGNATARLVEIQVTRLEALASRLDDRLRKSGFLTQSGTPNEAAQALVSLVDKLLSEARALLNTLSTTAAAPETKVVIEYADAGD